MKTTVIIPTKDRINDIKLVFDSFRIQSELPTELIIVDSSEKKGLDDFLRDNYNDILSQMNYYYTNTKPGLTSQRNLGIKLSSGEIIHFLEDDIALHKDYIKEMNNLFNTELQVVGATGIISNNKDINLLFQFFNRLFLLPSAWPLEKTKILKSHFGNMNNSLKKNTYVTRLRGVSSYRKTIFEEFQFDEKLEGYAVMEDIDFSFRVGKKYKLIQSPHVKFEHYPSNLNRLKVLDYYVMLKKNQKYLFIKNISSRWELMFLYWSRIGLSILEFLLKIKRKL